MTTLLSEPYVAVLPEHHALTRKRKLRVGDLGREPFVLFGRRVGPLAFDRTMACCQQHGFRPAVVQEATQWPTIVRLVAAGLGVSLAPACVASIAIPGAVYRDVGLSCRTTVDLGTKVAVDAILTRHFVHVATGVLAPTRQSAR